MYNIDVENEKRVLVAAGSRILNVALLRRAPAFSLARYKINELTVTTPRREVRVGIESCRLWECSSDMDACVTKIHSSFTFKNCFFSISFNTIFVT